MIKILKDYVGAVRENEKPKKRRRRMHGKPRHYSAYKVKQNPYEELKVRPLKFEKEKP